VDLTADEVYTIEENSDGGYNLVDAAGDTVATSADGKVFKDDADATVLESDVALEGGTVTANGTGDGVASATVDPLLQASSSDLDQGDYSITTDDSGTTYNTDGEDVLVLADAYMGTEDVNISIGGIDISSQNTADQAISTINDAIESVSAQRSELGAVQNRLEHTIANLDNSSENLSAAESRIRDVDMAKEMMEMTRANILSQASQSMLAQANQAPQSVLQLLG
jgi:flagellin